VKRVTIQELRKSLSKRISEVAAGAQITITRRGKPVAKLTPADVGSVYVGHRFGRANLRPLLLRGSRGRYLEELAKDRGKGDR